MSWEESVFIANVNVFDSVAGRVGGPFDVTVSRGVITSVAPSGALGAAGKRRLDGTGRTLIPGLIDAHWHTAFTAVPAEEATLGEVGYLHATASVRETLLRGFTTVRDMGGPSIPIKQAIDQGLIPGPRIYPSGPMICLTRGHGNVPMPDEAPCGIAGHMYHGDVIGASVIADGEDEAFRAAREVLQQGASQVKVIVEGAVASGRDSLDVAQYTVREMAAAVEEAENRGTYVTVHAHTAQEVRIAVMAGARGIEHGQLLDEASVALIAEHGIWWCLEPFAGEEDAQPLTGPNREKFLRVVEGTDAAYRLAIKHHAHVAFGTDTLFDARLATQQGAQLTRLARWYSPGEVLQQATLRNAELLALSGPCNPYPGRLGVVEEGAIADLILVDGDPVADLSLIAEPEKNFPVIIKDGQIIKGSDMLTLTHS